MSSSIEPVGQSYADLQHKIDPRRVSTIDPTDEAAAVVAQYPWNGGRNTDGRLKWGDKHDIYSEFLPFAYLDNDMLETLADIGEFLNSRPVTNQRVSTAELTTRTGLDGNQPGTYSFADACLLHGWWRGGETSSGGAYYCNPDYVHDHDESDYLDAMTYWDDEAGEYVNDRFEFAIQAARLGVQGPVASRAFGMENKRSASKWFHRRGFDWEAEREAGRRRMAQTWKTIQHWGYTCDEIGAVFGAANSTVSGRIRRDAPDFEPPADPSLFVVERGDI